MDYSQFSQSTIFNHSTNTNNDNEVYSLKWQENSTVYHPNHANGHHNLLLSSTSWSSSSSAGLEENQLFVDDSDSFEIQPNDFLETGCQMMMVEVPPLLPLSSVVSIAENNSVDLPAFSQITSETLIENSR